MYKRRVGVSNSVKDLRENHISNVIKHIGIYKLFEEEKFIHRISVTE